MSMWLRLHDVVKIHSTAHRQGREASQIDAATLKPIQGARRLPKHVSHEVCRRHAFHAKRPWGRGISRLSKGRGLGTLGSLVGRLGGAPILVGGVWMLPLTMLWMLLLMVLSLLLRWHAKWRRRPA